MFNQRSTQLIIAVCTSCALIAFAVYQRGHAISIPRFAFYGAAAILCLIEESYGWFCNKSCRSKSLAR